MGRKLIIGDIHGCLKTFNALLGQFRLNKDDHLFLLGDYIDRGLDSKGVIDKIFELKDEGYSVTALRGNHEQMLLNNYTAEVDRGLYAIVEDEIKESFKIQNFTQIPVEYIRFFKELPYFYEDKDFILVHAGMNFNCNDPYRDKKALLWARTWYNQIDYDWLDSKIIIHGHTMQSKNETEMQFKLLAKNQVIDIDCGAVLSRNEADRLGWLCGFDFTNQKLYFQENIEFNNY